jgi:predicted GIY-YIG superfamily endonuclease
MQFIYVLGLQEGKYYVGKTNDITRRLQEHQSGSGCEWTKRYRMVKLLHSEQSSDPYDEDKITKKWMAEKGINNVRGGVYSQVVLPDEQIASINRELRGAEDKCLGCGRDGHMVKNCPFRSDALQPQHRIQGCTRCGRDNHTKNNCYAQYDIDGEPLPCQRCGRDNHITDECYAKMDINGRYLRN